MSERITKRLHISGLTSQISEQALKDRFASFGTVRALDGYGKRDGNGDFRPFAYLTLESTKGQLAQCLNLLSGATWKGTKLRIGVAKPDYRERITKENESAKRTLEEDSSRPKKRRRLLRGCQGVHSADMSLVTSENFSKRSGWRKTPLGRLIRPIRMRPPRPLPPPSDLAKSGKSGWKKKVKRKRIGLLTRARRKLIDPTRWGSEYLRGVLLENSISTSHATPQLIEDLTQHSEDSSTIVSESESSHEDTDMNASGRVQSSREDGLSHTSQSPTPLLLNSGSIQTELRSPPEATSDIARESAKDLALLASIFGDANSTTNDWGGEESLSDIEVERVQARTANISEGDVGDIEMVPRERAVAQKEVAISNESVELDSNENVEVTVEPVSKSQSTPAQVPKVQTTRLKDMFAPREEDAVGFSLLGNLDIDLELDDSMNFAPISTTTQALHTSRISLEPEPSPFTTTYAHAHPAPALALDSTAPLFFPIFDPSQQRSRGRSKDILSIAHERGWDTAFFRTENDDEIKKRWEKAKTELTAEWKRRHREGVKSVRRRGGGQE